MFKFSLRELLLLTLVAGLALGWWLDRSHLIRRAAQDLADAEKVASERLEEVRQLAFFGSADLKPSGH